MFISFSGLFRIYIFTSGKQCYDWAVKCNWVWQAPVCPGRLRIWHKVAVKTSKSASLFFSCSICLCFHFLFYFQPGFTMLCCCLANKHWLRFIWLSLNGKYINTPRGKCGREGKLKRERENTVYSNASLFLFQQLWNELIVFQVKELMLFCVYYNFFPHSVLLVLA